MVAEQHSSVFGAGRRAGGASEHLTRFARCGDEIATSRFQERSAPHSLLWIRGIASMGEPGLPYTELQQFLTISFRFCKVNPPGKKRHKTRRRKDAQRLRAKLSAAPLDGSDGESHSNLMSLSDRGQVCTTKVVLTKDLNKCNVRNTSISRHLYKETVGADSRSPSLGWQRDTIACLSPMGTAIAAGGVVHPSLVKSALGKHPSARLPTSVLLAVPKTSGQSLQLGAQCEFHWRYPDYISVREKCTRSVCFIGIDEP